MISRASRLFPYALVALGITACVEPPASVVVDASEPAADAPVVIDASEVDASPLDADDLPPLPPVDASTCPAPPGSSFVEEYVSPCWIESGIEALVTGDGGSLQAAIPPYADIGDGSEGPLVVNTDTTLAAGDHDYTMIVVGSGAVLTVPAAATLRVQGSLHVSAGARLRGIETLTLAIGGEFVVDCANIEARADLSILQQASQGVTVRCSQAGQTARLSTVDDATTSSPGSVRLWSRGSITIGPGALLNTGKVSGAAPIDAMGGLSVLADGDVLLVAGARLLAGGGPSAAGWVSVNAGGSLTLEPGVIVAGGTSATGKGGTAGLLAGSTLTVDGASIFSGPSSTVEVAAPHGACAITNAAVVRARASTLAGGGTVLLHCGTLNVNGGALVEAEPTLVYSGGGIAMSVRGQALVSGATVRGGDAPCMPGGLGARVDGDLIVADGATVRAGDASGGACAQTVGGQLLVRVSGSVTTTGGTLRSGLGEVAGESSVLAHVDPGLDPLGSPSSYRKRVVSVGFPVAANAAKLMGITPTWRSLRAGTILVSPLGELDDFRPAADVHLVGSGWRYAVELEPTAFEPVELERLDVVLAPP